MMFESTGDMTRHDDTFEFSKLEESKRMDEDSTIISDKQRMTTKEKVQKLKEDLKRRKAMLKGEIQITEEGEGGGTNPNDTSIVIDTSIQEQAEINAAYLKEYVATGSRDKKIRVFEVKSGRLVLTLIGHDNWVTDLHFHPNGKYLISTADDKSIRIWDLSMGRCYRKIYNAHDHFISTFAMRGKMAASASVDTSCKIW